MILATCIFTKQVLPSETVCGQVYGLLTVFGSSHSNILSFSSPWTYSSTSFSCSCGALTAHSHPKQKTCNVQIIFQDNIMFFKRFCYFFLFPLTFPWINSRISRTCGNLALWRNNESMTLKEEEKRSKLYFLCSVSVVTCWQWWKCCQAPKGFVREDEWKDNGKTINRTEWNAKSWMQIKDSKLK